MKLLSATKWVMLGDAYLEALSGILKLTAILDDLFYEHVGKRELRPYRVVGLFLIYVLPYAFGLVRLLRALEFVFFTNAASMVFEQRPKYKLQRLRRLGA